MFLLYSCALFLCWPTLAQTQEFTVTGQVEIVSERPKSPQKRDASNVVVWLTPLDDRGLKTVSHEAPAQPARLVQKEKKFTPHLLVVPAGTAVEFPNRDPFFHNVFSLFEGKRFDLGLYEAGTTRFVHFDRVGVSYIFCNIQPEMSAVVVALKTPYYAISTASGKIEIAHLPEGRYLLQVWAENASSEGLKALRRNLTISSETQSLGVMRVVEEGLPVPHKNKYGRDYDAPGSDYPVNNQK